MYQDGYLCTIHHKDDFFPLHVSVTCHIKHKASRIGIQILLVSLIPAEPVVLTEMARLMCNAPAWELEIRPAREARKNM